MTRQEIRNLARKRLGETTAAFWSDAELNAWINNGCRDLSFRTKCIRTNGYYSTSDCTQNIIGQNANEVSLSATFQGIYAVLEVYFHVNGRNWIKLDSITRTELDHLHPGWQDSIGYAWTDPSSGTIYYNYRSTPGVPTRYYWDREEDVLGIWLPTDTDNTTSDNVRVYYVKAHTDISDDTQVPQLPEPLYLAIADYVAATGLETRGWVDKSNDLWQKYFSKIRDYQVERGREREDDDIVMKNYRNI